MSVYHKPICLLGTGWGVPASKENMGGHELTFSCGLYAHVFQNCGLCVLFKDRAATKRGKKLVFCFSANRPCKAEQILSLPEDGDTGPCL